MDGKSFLLDTARSWALIIMNQILVVPNLLCSFCLYFVFSGYPLNEYGHLPYISSYEKRLMHWQLNLVDFLVSFKDMLANV